MHSYLKLCTEFYDLDKPTAPDGARIIISWMGNYDDLTSVSSNIHRYDLIQESQLLETEFEEFNIRHYEIDEFRELLLAAGFQNLKLYKGYDFCPPDEKDGNVVFECVKL